VRGLHGLGGEVRVEVLTDRPDDRFAPGVVLFPEGTSHGLTVAAAGAVADGPGWYVTFEGVRDRTAAEPLRDVFLEVAVDRSSDLPPGQAYWHEVIGTKVVGTTGRALGAVADVYRAGEAEVYVVEGGPDGGFDLPAVRGIVTEFALERGEIVVDEAALNLGDTGSDAPARTKPRRRPRWSRHGKGSGGATPPAGSDAAE